LSLHRTGQWYKKIHGKFYYFGTDRDNAIGAYHEQATRLHAGGSVHGVQETRRWIYLILQRDLFIDHPVYKT